MAPIVLSGSFMYIDIIAVEKEISEINARMKNMLEMAELYQTTDRFWERIKDMQRRLGYLTWQQDHAKASATSPDSQPASAAH